MSTAVGTRRVYYMWRGCRREGSRSPADGCVSKVHYEDCTKTCSTDLCNGDDMSVTSTAAQRRRSRVRSNGATGLSVSACSGGAEFTVLYITCLVKYSLAATVWTNFSLIQAPHHKSMTCAFVDIPIPFRQWKQLILWKVLLYIYFLVTNSFFVF